ncbi:Alpha/Beta hydrolase protein [Apiospora aurea]|uniref:Carboxylic ester hydrolase n=1 Tax=Apiospora aurea TaxID=335848 RepID=A0ABR1QPP9_9PEZI
MQLPTAHLLAAGLVGVGAAAAQTPYDAELTVNTTGGRYTGFVDTATAPDVNQWRGVRYGQAPVGSRRFLPPLAAEDDGLHRYARDWPTWVQRMQTHIVVTFNYRLNVFGFPGANGAMTNAGFLDARLVVEWAKDNIEAFGGDPERMILWGQSAGAGLTASYVYANGEDPIIAGAIANSGTVGIGPGSDDDSGSVNKFSQLADIVGCGGLDAEEELECMQGIPAQTLQSVLQSGREDVPSFGAVVDNVTTFSNYTERLEKGLVAKIPLITGTTSNEAAALVGGFDKNATTPPPKLPNNPVGGFDCSLREELKDRLDNGHITYRYLFAGNFSNITPRYWLGAMHSSDLPLIFGTHYQFRGNSTELEWQTSYAMEDMWVAFATDPSKDPSTSSGLVWPKYSPDGETVVLFGNGTEAAQLAPPSIADISDCSDG